MNSNVVKAGAGNSFPFGEDLVTIKVSASDTNGTHSLMEWVVAEDVQPIAHFHEDYEETFYLLSGSLEFTLDQETFTASTGDFVRVPAGTRHAFANCSNEKVKMLVGFTPGGMEHFFEKYQNTGDDFDLEGYLSEAKSLHKTVYEVGS